MSGVVKMGSFINYKGIKTNNIRNINLKLEKQKIIGISGPSGSGKTSLAYDTIYQISKYEFDKIDNNKVEITESTIDDDGFQYVTTSKEGSNYSILIEKSKFNTTEIWVKNSVPLKTKKNSKGKLIKIGGGYVMTYMAINCENKEFNVEEKVSYNSKGEVINSDKFGSYGNKIVPGSVMSAIYKFVCNN